MLCSWVNCHVNILDGELDRTSVIAEEVLNGVIANVCFIALVPASVPVLESSVLSGPEKIRSRDPWSHIVS